MKWVYAAAVAFIVFLIIWRVIRTIFFGQSGCGAGKHAPEKEEAGRGSKPE